MSNKPNPIRTRRKQLALSQKALAELLQVDQATVSRAENADQADPRYVYALEGIAVEKERQP